MDASPSITESISPKPSQRHMDQATYRDLVIFEERLRGNMNRLQQRKRKFEGSDAFVYHLLNTTALLIVAGSLVFFYRSGMYSEKIVYAAKFVPHCNRALQSFNLQFIQRGQSGELGFYSRIPQAFQDGFNAYRRQYYARKRARQAKMKSKSL
ncbi:hypothetical protein EC973_003215 [Apophysomyces ossiformis]|uniref:Transmembrane protein 188 n=1 Tax=Apophysomyces ossiformis TaxID=679940 RepID=A0A8H7BWN7_9FUNG|nr:hypothetical protein EC973_003215 [Apophysomyces ossiformis]